MDHKGGSDAIYDDMDGEQGNVGKAFLDMQQAREQRLNHREFTGGPDADRKPRSSEAMHAEAEWFRTEMDEDNTV